MYRPPHAAGDASSRRFHPLPPTPVPRPSSLAPALAAVPVPRPAALAPVLPPRPADLRPAPLVHPALLVPPLVVSTPPAPKETGFHFPASTMDSRCDDLLDDEQFVEEEAYNDSCNVNAM
nr:unnamed protein product [Digitaria exilis]